MPATERNENNNNNDLYSWLLPTEQEERVSPRPPRTVYQARDWVQEAIRQTEERIHEAELQIRDLRAVQVNAARRRRGRQRRMRARRSRHQRLRRELTSAPTTVPAVVPTTTTLRQTRMTDYPEQPRQFHSTPLAQVAAHPTPQRTTSSECETCFEV